MTHDDGESISVTGINAGEQTARARAELGADIVLLVAGLLDPQDLVAASQVCRAWRSALVGSSVLWSAHADGLHEWDGGLGPRERVLRHVGTERAWATGDVRTTTHSVAYTLDDWMDFKLDARSGLALMEVRGGAALVDTRSWTTARLLSDDEWLSVNLFPGTLALTDPEAMTIEVFDVRRANGSVELVSQHKFHVSTMTAVMALNTPSGAAAAVVSHAISAAEEGVRHKLSIHSAPDWDEGQLVDVEQYAVSALDDTNLMPLLGDKMLVLSQDGDTEVWPAGYAHLGVIPSFPFSEVDSASLAYRVRLGRWVARPSDAWTLSEVSGIEVRGLVEGDEGFMGVVAPSYQDTNTPVRHACFNDTDLACAVIGHTLLILRDYAAVFASLVSAEEDERDDVLRRNTIAVRFDARIHAVKGHGPRFAIATDRDVVVLDSRRLPSMPLDRGSDVRPSLHALVLAGAFPTHSSGGKTRRVDAKLAIDERAVYLFASASKTVTVHAFGE